MPYAVEKFDTGPQSRETFGDLNLAYGRARDLADDTGESFAIFDGDHNLEDVITPEPRWIGYEVVERADTDIAYVIAALNGAKEPATKQRGVWRGSSEAETAIIDATVALLLQARAKLGEIYDD